MRDDVQTPYAHDIKDMNARRESIGQATEARNDGECIVRLVVQKFGGTSVATAERIMAAARRAIRAKTAGHQVIVVVSARGDTTDELIELAPEISDNPPPRKRDTL